MMAVKQADGGQARTREEYKKQKQERTRAVDVEGNQPALDVGASRRIRVRLIPIWLRLVLLAVLIVVSVTAGALVGYSGLGGGKAVDVFKLSTWTHIRDLVEKEK